MADQVLARARLTCQQPIFSTSAWAKALTKCDFPVPDGPATARFSCLPTYFRVDSAFWVAFGVSCPASVRMSTPATAPTS